MRREGRQQGSARTYCNLPSSPPKPTKPLGSTQPTSGAFTRVPSKSTAAMYGHLHHSWKSKEKIKGAQKLRASDLDLGYDEIVVLRVTGKAHDESMPECKLKIDRYSAQDLVDALENISFDFDDYY